MTTRHRAVFNATHQLTAPAGQRTIDHRFDASSFVFPVSWDLQIMRMAGHHAPELSPEIIKRIKKPIASRSLAEFAAGKQTAVNTFDDLTRPTPIASVALLVVEELKGAGIPEENILFSALLAPTARWSRMK